MGVWFGTEQFILLKRVFGLLFFKVALKAASEPLFVDILLKSEFPA